MSFYAGLRATADRLLDQFGMTVVIQRPKQGVIDPVAGVMARIAPELIQTTGVLQRIPDSLMDGTRVKQGDRWLTLTAGVKPEITDRLLIGGVSWSITEIEEVSPAGTELVYRVRARR